MSDKFDINFELLPPELKVKLWVLSLDADTSQVALAYKRGAFKTSLQFDYDGKASAGMSYRRWSGNFGIKTDSGDIDLGLVYHGYNFTISSGLSRAASGAIGADAGFDFGAKLLPFPSELTTTFNAGGKSITSMAGDWRSAVKNPLDFYKTRSDDIDAVKKAVDLGQSIYDAGKGPRFGGKLRLHYTGETGLTIYLGAGVMF